MLHEWIMRSDVLLEFFPLFFHSIYYAGASGSPFNSVGCFKETDA